MELDRGAVRVLFELVGEDHELFDELVTAFREEGPQRIAELRRAVDGADSALAGRAAHTLKSNGATFGATELASLCRRLEGAARLDDLAGATQLVDEVERCWALVDRELDSLDREAPG